MVFNTFESFVNGLFKLGIALLIVGVALNNGLLNSNPVDMILGAFIVYVCILGIAEIF
jgi:hypothetical protein